MYEVLFPILTLTWRVNIYVSRQERVLIGETKVQRTEVFLSLWSTDDNIPVLLIPFIVSFITGKSKLIFSFSKK